MCVLSWEFLLMQNNKDAFGPLMIAISNDLRIEIGPGIP